MKRNIIISTDYFNPQKYNHMGKFIEYLQENSDSFIFYIISKNMSCADSIVNWLKGMGISCNSLMRNTQNISKYLDYECVIGNKNVDFYLATASKKIIFYDENIEVENKVSNYGLSFNINDLGKILKIINCSTSNDLYADTMIDNKTRLIALINAKSKYGYRKREEMEFISLLQRFLKKGDMTDKKTCYLFFIYLLLQLQKADLPVPNYIFYYPSSSGQDNFIMKEITEMLRNVFHLRIEQEELMKRSKPIVPSKNLEEKDRIKCDRHFQSISINYKYDLHDKNVWVLDDYFTNGTSFETTRNLLKNQELKSLSLIAIGAFGKAYKYQDYDTSYNIMDSYDIYINYSDEYRNVIDKLIDIINS